MLRRLLFAAAFLGCCLAGQAQKAPAKETFATYDSQFELQRRQLSEAHQYPQLLKMYGDWHRAYAKLPAAQKAEFQNRLPNIYYNEACYYSLAHQADPAVRCFGQAVAAGWRDYQHATVDTDFDYIRTNPGFQQQLAVLRERGDYLYVLKQAGPYAPGPGAALPAYTYQPAAEPHLAALRQRYKLDSVAGQQSDVARFINLLHWVHNQVPHDGQHGNPASRNAQDLLTVCQRDKRGLNCRGLATVLNEVYLAMGYQSHFVTCLPKDTLDPDCHVINVVYAPSLRKWVWMDPTNDAYVMNEQGTLLGIEEVRARLLDGRPLLLNPDANWNHRQSATKEQYLYSYMAKNLYKLEIPVASQYDFETRQPGRTYEYLQLLPQAALGSGPATRTHHYPKEDVTFTTHTTSDPAAFWQVPPVAVP
ncbi:transglutaminase domain-containing protein [Hymenobacter sp. RP-2-7]|uniref:Transglutaminase domain-containing protein n=1 Tax=Hymenobacter polaris TaxID=2682546 RepID=A0A7Y0AHQ8_9BACT|nr:transglutaminase domain-containing protein [Hymenobacter polaris]NML67566.1 transglutaminase domain-containing protein [Hymenobacter polaris]